MLTRCLRAANPLGCNVPFLARGFATEKKNYYQILGLSKDASTEDIKSAYRNLAKRYHPDVNASAEVYEGDAEKFRDVVEAYQVLSVEESRTAYDTSNQPNPDAIYRAQRMEQQRKYTARTKDGNPVKQPFAPGSYAEEKRKYLASERKKFNVDAFGRYKGGVPAKGRGFLRGTSLGTVGTYHDPLIHNTKVDPDPATQTITTYDTLAFKRFQNDDSFALKRRWTWFQAKVDYDYLKFNDYRYGWRWFRNVLGLFFGLTGLAVLAVQARNRMLIKKVERLGNTVNLREGVEVAGHFIQQGETGILKITENPKKAQHHHGH